MFSLPRERNISDVRVKRAHPSSLASGLVQGSPRKTPFGTAAMLENVFRLRKTDP
jgi:hypothetical protein